MLQGRTEINLWTIWAAIPWFQSNSIVGKCQFQLKRKTNSKCLAFPNLSNRWGRKCGNGSGAPASPVLCSAALCVGVQAVQAFHSSTPSCYRLLSTVPSSSQPVCRTQAPEDKGNKPTLLLKEGTTMGPNSRSPATLISGLQGIRKVHWDQWEMSQRVWSQPWSLTDDATYGLVRFAKASVYTQSDWMTQ